MSTIEPTEQDSESRRRIVEVYANCLNRLKRIAAGMGFAPADAEDILGDVFLEALQGKAKFRCEKEARHWLLRVTVNRCLLEFRRRKRFRRTAKEILKRQEQNQPSTQQPQDRIIQAEEKEGIRKARDSKSTAGTKG